VNDLKNKLPKISERERDVMLILWREGERLTASGVAKKGGGLSINTVQAAVRNLMKKGYIEIADIVYSGTVLTRSYKPIISVEQYAADQLQALRMDASNFSALSFAEYLHKNDETGTSDELESVIRQRK
jgi:predicted transcriptional regulator